MTEKFICFDIGGTKIFKSVVEVNFGQRSFEFLNSETIKNPIDADRIKDEVINYCQKNKEKFDTNKIAISSASITNLSKLVVFQVSDIYGVEKFDFNFLKELGFQVVLENDGEAFSLGTYYFENNEEKQGLLTLTLGSGIGGGFISTGGEVLRGKENSATEFSHIKMFIDGKWEKWECISAGRGIEKMYLEKNGEKKSAKDVFEEIEKDEVAKEVISKSKEYLGQGIANLIDIFNPEKIVFGGSIVKQEAYVQGAIEIAERNIFNKKAMPEWSISRLKAEMNVLGVCALYYV